MLSGNFDLLDINQALSKVQAHDHLCLIYQNIDEWRNVLVPYLGNGFKKKEKCIYIGDASKMAQVELELQKGGMDVPYHISSRQLVLFESHNLSDSPEDATKQMMQMLINETRKALKNGYTALRVTDDMSWVSGMDWELLLDYAAKLNRDIFSAYPCVLLCQYNQNTFDARIIQDVLFAHPAFIRRNHLYVNNYYIPPEILLSNQRDDYQLEEWFNNMERERLYGDRVGFLADVVQRSSQPFVTSSPDGEVITCNNAFCQVTGYSLEEARKLNLWTHLHVLNDDDASNWQLRDLYSTGCPQHFETDILCKDGSTVPVEEFIHQVCDIDGHVKYHCSFINDITIRKKNEAAIKESEKELQEQLHFLQNFIDSIPTPAFYRDLDGNFQFCNKPFQEAIGLPRDRIIGQSLYAVLPKDLADKYREMDLTLLSTSGIQCYDWQFQYADGTRHDVIFNKAPLSNSRGEFIGVVGTTVDITQRKRAEDALKNSQAQLRRITENMVDMISQITTSGRFEFVSPSHKHILGYEPDELMNRSFFDLVHPEDLNRVKVYFNTAITKEYIGKIDYRYKCKDGSFRSLETDGKVIYEDEKIIGIVFGSRDVTERKQMEKEIARLDRLRVVGEMAASLGHEIRNPMTTVRGFLQVLEDSDGCEPYREYFDLMIEELDGVNAIVTEYLSLAKDKAVYFTQLDLNQVIKAMYPLISADAIKSDKQVTLDLGNIPQVMVDAKEIRQLILNLSRNGLESMDSGGHLIIRTVSDDVTVTLEVEDQGHGIEKDVLDKIGTPFFSTKDTGTGLGMAVCYSIAARHHAKIDIKTGNTGSVFSVIFNIQPQDLGQERMIS